MSATFVNPATYPLINADAATGGSQLLSFPGAPSAGAPALSQTAIDVMRRLTPEDIRAGAERIPVMLNILHLKDQGYSLTDIARKVGRSAGTVCNLLKEFGHLPTFELTAERLATARGEGGRRIDAEILARLPEVRQALQQLYLSTIQGSSEYITKGRRTGSASLALMRFADNPICPPALARALRRGSQPRALLNVIREINSEIEQKYRGQEHSELNGTLIQRRELVEILEDGTKLPIHPGDWWVFDDMSTNFPFWWTDADGRQLVGRQGLYAYDVCQRWIGCELVGTSRDSYTAAIILRFFRRLFKGLGKPRRGVVLERSVWAASSIKGFRVTSSGDVIEQDLVRPSMSKDDKTLIHDGLEAIGLHVHYTHTPRGKEIEGGFAYLQRVFPTFATRLRSEATARHASAINLGHHAGEFERGAKAMRQAHSGSRLPEDLQFLHIDQHADLTEKTMQWINRRKSGQWAVTSDQSESQSDHSPLITSHYPKLAALSERDFAAFLAERNEVAIRDGKVTVQRHGIVADFTNPTVFAHLGTGFRVYVKWDSSEPSVGAAIYSRETSSANFAGYQVGEYICSAEYHPTVARFDWREEACGPNDVAHQHKKAFNQAVRTAFRAVGMPALKAATARDGKGQVVEVGNSGQGLVTSVQSDHSPLTTSHSARPTEPVLVPPARRRTVPESISERGKNLLARQARMAREAMAETH